MPVLLKKTFTTGWKEKENSRYNPVLTIDFINEADGKRMFSYAPNLDEIPFWNEFLKDLQVYDELSKAQLAVLNRIDPDKASRYGDCPRNRNRVLHDEGTPHNLTTHQTPSNCAATTLKNSAARVQKSNQKEDGQ